MICHKSDLNSISQVSSKLKNGEVVILPTDTVYGFSSAANNNLQFCPEIMKIKGRDENKPLIQLISSPEDVFNYSDTKIPEKLLKYWPGPLTIIVEDKRYSTNESKISTAFRCPGDQWLRQVIKEAGFPIFSTSVNRSGKPVLTREKEIIHEFEKEVGLIVLDGDSESSVPSTIVKIDGDSYEILRKGAVNLN